jgi:hypothetical protein
VQLALLVRSILLLLSSRKTAHGVGIGSARSVVDCVYGLSEQPESPDNWYTAANVLHWVIFEADTVTAIWMFDREFVDPASSASPQ